MTVRNEAPPVEMTRPGVSLMIGAPMYGGLCHDAFLLGMMDLKDECHRHGIPLSIITIRNESLIQRGRNRIVAEFLASPCSHLVFIDADIGFTGRDVLRLVAHDRPLIGATYAKKDRRRIDFAFVPLSEGAEVQEGGIVEIEALPGGFMCVRRDMVAQMIGAFRHRRYRVAPSEAAGQGWESHLYSLFECDICPVTGTYWSEDYLFCKRWRDIGGQVFLDPHIILEHHGTTLFTGDPDTVFRVVGAATQQTSGSAEQEGTLNITGAMMLSDDVCRGAMASGDYGQNGKGL